MGKYQIRRAAGVYWLIDMEQSGMNYHSPVPMNETGARIWGMLSEGKTADVIGKTLAEEYAVPEAEIRADIQQFLDLLAAKGINSV